MEEMIKDLENPTITETIEAAPALPTPVEESTGFGWPTYGVGIVILGVIVVGLYKNYCRCKK